MKQRDHLYYERYLAVQEASNLKASADKQKTEEKKKEREDFYDSLNKYREQRELKRSELRKFAESVCDNYMETALNAIYISALQQIAPLSEESIILAEKNTANYIKEHGGARNIIRSNKGRTSLLDTIFEAVSTATNNDVTEFLKLQEAEKEEEEEEKKDKESEDKEEDSKKDDKDDNPAEGDENKSGEDIKVGDADGDGEDDAEQLDDGAEASKESEDDNEEDPVTDKEDTKETLDDDKPKDDSEDDKESEDSEDKEEKKNYTDELDEDDDEEDDSSDDENSDDEDSSDSEEDDSDDDIDVEDGFKAADDSSDDSSDDEDDNDSKEEEPDEDALDKESPDGETPGGESTEDDVSDSIDDDTLDDNGNLKDNKEEMFKKLENDAEVTDAVDIIAKRISDAETEFIQKNAEDKKKIEQIVNKVDDRIKAVTDSDKDPEAKEEDIESTQQEATRMITDIKEKRFHSIFEELVKDNFDYIMKDVSLKESYTDINGKINVAQIVESSRVMYGFLEFVNTIQLEKVNSEYILKVIKNQI